MGHERVGYLPKTKRWTSIVSDIGSFSSNQAVIADIAIATTKNVRTRFRTIGADEGVLSAFKYLILLSHAAKQENALAFLSNNGIAVSSDFDLFDIGISAKDFIEKHQESREYTTLATQSLMDTISDWFHKNESKQGTLFELPDNPLEKWSKVSTGEGFCEISRLFFSNFTKRYLRYFLEREAAWKLKNVQDRVQFNNRLESFVEDISRHAFETSKITQSFSAGWFNKHVKDCVPSDKKIKGFVDFSFHKINSELLREESK